MTLIFVLSGASGSRLLPSSISAPDALGPPVVGVDAAAHEQRGEPLRARDRRARDHGRVTPDGERLQPRQGHRHARAAEERPAGSRRRRLDRVIGRVLVLPAVAVHSLVQELRAGDDGFDQAAEAVAVGRQLRSHVVEGHVVREQQAAAQGVGQQLAAEVVDEFVLPALAQVRLQATRARRPRRRRGTSPSCRRAGRRGPSSAVRRSGRSPRRPGRTRRTVVAAGAALVARGASPALRAGSARRASPRRRAAPARRRRGGMCLAEQPAHDPVAALDRAGPQAGANSWSGTPPSAAARRGRTCRRRRSAPSRSGRVSARACRSAGRATGFTNVCLP